MSAEGWGNYGNDNDTGFEPPYDRGPITSELELSDSQLREVEEVLGFSPDQAFDMYRDGQKSERIGGGTRGTTGTENGEVVLEAYRDITADTLAHESVHGMIRQPDASEDLPGEDYLDHDVYEETVAILAESEIREARNDDVDLRGLKRHRERYMKMRQRPEVLDDEFESLYDDVVAMDDVMDEEVSDLKDQKDRYQKMRKTVLAREAANEYRQENQIDIESLVNPDQQEYHEVMDYVESIENNLEERIK